MTLAALQADVDGETSEGDESLEVVVLAANRLGLTASATRPDAGDRVASNPNGDINILNAHAEESEKLGSERGVCQLGILATLDGAGVAGVVGAALNGGGGRQGDEGGGENESGGVHCGEFGFGLGLGWKDRRGNECGLCCRMDRYGGECWVL